MSLEFNFNIEELPDAKSFIFTDLTGDYSVLNTGGWGAPNVIKEVVEKFTITFKKLIRGTASDEIYKQYSLNTTDYPVDAWKNGVELFFDGDKILFFEDGAYEINFKLQYNSGELITEVTKNFGFFAIIKDSTMNQLMTYNLFLPKRSKEIYWEKTRLLDNMFYATQTDQILQFEENLEALNKLK